MKILKKFINQKSAFSAIGPFIGTLIVIITFHSFMFADNPSRFIQGLITPHIIFPMLFAFVCILPFGYLIGLLPSIISKLLFEHFYAVKINSASVSRATLYGFFLGLMWSPLILVICLATGADFKLFLYVEFVLILPVCIVCTWIEWRKAMKSISQSLKTTE
ncbi:hypothetical protein [Acinetobacter sp. Marseille-Q1618]|uniref:hypothetical protein n=1 Tax=Acinetobacter sp. Marseille-Q1618 TaxID=2697502 RepID=UPI00156FA31B|nr:hypothetical protein [Acinetobacter sp. Marseille-Q1618]